MKFLYLTAALFLASTSVFAGSMDPGSMSSTVFANGSDVYYETFYANETAIVEVRGNCPSVAQDIDLWIYDEFDNLIVKSTGNTCFERAVWNPIWTGAFKIVIENSNKPYDTSYTYSSN